MSYSYIDSFIDGISNIFAEVQQINGKKILKFTIINSSFEKLEKWCKALI